jgi:hypothetical protein
MGPSAPLPDRVVIVVLVATVGLCFALTFWFVRLQPPEDSPFLWREGPAQPRSPVSPGPGRPVGPAPSQQPLATESAAPLNRALLG